MINTLTVPNYYFRDYKNDFPKAEEKSDYASQAIRVTKVALPFIALYRPFGVVLTCGLGLARAVTSPWGVHTVCAVASVVGTIFLHPLGMVVATLHDMGINAGEVYGAVCRGQYLETAKQIMYLANHVFYLMIMVYGSVELQVASLAAAVLVEAVMSLDEYHKGHWLEATGHILMSAIRASQLQTKVVQMQRKWEIDAAIQSFYVGALREKWQFPSDHLPVGIEVNGTKVISWNVLNNAYMDWVIEKDSQGLNGSMISDLHLPIGEDELTKRDQRVIDMLLSMMDPKTGVIALQECGQPFVNALEKHLPEQWKMVRSGEGTLVDQELLLYNTAELSLVQSETINDGYLCNLGRLIQNALFMQNGKPLRIINSHLPGDPALPGKEEFARYIKSQAASDEVTVALGDMNFERQEMERAYQSEGFLDFILHSPWQTNIDPYTRKSKGIDHLLVLGDATSRDLKAEEIAGSEFLLQETIDLLRQAVLP